MSGGFTLSGGEPLMQHRFAVKLFAAAKAMGIHTALDTNGYYGDRLTDAELETIDLVLLDIKAWDPERHRALTGMDNAPTLAFARRLAARRRPVWLRYVLVPGLTDDLDDIARIARFAAGLGQRRARRRAAVSSDGPVQVEEARHPLHARRHRAAGAGTRRGGVRRVSRAGLKTH